MTGLERKASAAWAMMVASEAESMPPGIALDFVQEECDSRDDALEAILTAMQVWLANRRPEAGNVTSQRPGWHYRAGAVGGLLQVELHDLAQEKLSAFREQITAVLCDDEQCADPEVAAVARAWGRWSCDALRAIDICRVLSVAAYPAGIPHEE